MGQFSVEKPGAPGSVLNGNQHCCPSKPETLAQRLIAHFLPILASDACPSAELIDGQEAFDLSTAASLASPAFSNSSAFAVASFSLLAAAASTNRT